jgi:hypothetical protein
MRIGIQLRFIAMGAQSGSRIDPVQQMVIHHHLSRSEPGGRGDSGGTRHRSRDAQFTVSGP